MFGFGADRVNEKKVGLVRVAVRRFFVLSAPGRYVD